MGCDRRGLTAAIALGLVLADPALAQERYDAGASDTEIRVGHIIP